MKNMTVNDSLSALPLDQQRRAIYDRLVVQCDRPGCNKSFLLKQRDKHYKVCESFVRYRCMAPVCKIIECRDCPCPDCKNHNCFAMAKLMYVEEGKEPPAGHRAEAYDRKKHRCRPCRRCKPVEKCPHRNDPMKVCGAAILEDGTKEEGYHEDCTWGKGRNKCFVDHAAKQAGKCTAKPKA